MSFLIDPPMLVGAGALAETKISDEKSITRVEKVTLAVFLAVSVSLYLNLKWTKWMWEIVGADSGRDFMLNSRLFHFEHRSPSLSTHATALGLFASYPLWFKLGRLLGRNMLE
ncbi:MAG: hypothetical protein M1483_04745 [Actinobacteria bacterium]|nr:hypothetical protein [Actinomycetota bacterium]MCL6104921.1 hypothetical protein [Actinomycetota bacterium]